MLRFLVVNVGSTSLKFKLFAFKPPEIGKPRGVEAEGRLEGIGRPRSTFKIKVADTVEAGETTFPNYEAALAKVLEALAVPTSRGADLTNLSAICFKPVHARNVPLEITEMNEDVLDRMAEFNSVVPAHNPPVIAAVRSFRKMLPDVPLLGLFEPAFHQHLEPQVYTESVPLDWIEEFGIRKYGFHGASHRYIAERTPEFLGVPKSDLKIVSCHLGGSSSITAIRDGRSVDTSMSFSAQSGLPQGTRCGHIDPFIPFFLMKEKGWTIDQVAETLSRKSGLLGLSGVSAEFREIAEAARDGNPRAQRAIDVYVYQVQKTIAEMTVPLEGMNALVFTGGIGERGFETRHSICAGIAHLGVALDAEKNRAAVGMEAFISTTASTVAVAVIPTDEEIVIARDAAKYLLAAESPTPPGIK